MSSNVSSFQPLMQVTSLISSSVAIPFSMRKSIFCSRVMASLLLLEKVGEGFGFNEFIPESAHGTGVAPVVFLFVWNAISLASILLTILRASLWRPLVTLITSEFFMLHFLVGLCQAKLYFFTKLHGHCIPTVFRLQKSPRLCHTKSYGYGNAAETKNGQNRLKTAILKRKYSFRWADKMENVC